VSDKDNNKLSLSFSAVTFFIFLISIATSTLYANRFWQYNTNQEHFRNMICGLVVGFFVGVVLWLVFVLFTDKDP